MSASSEIQDQGEAHQPYDDDDAEKPFAALALRTLLGILAPHRRPLFESTLDAIARNAITTLKARRHRVGTDARIRR